MTGAAFLLFLFSLWSCGCSGWSCCFFFVCSLCSCSCCSCCCFFFVCSLCSCSCCSCCCFFFVCSLCSCCSCCNCCCFFFVCSVSSCCCCFFFSCWVCSVSAGAFGVGFTSLFFVVSVPALFDGGSFLFVTAVTGRFLLSCPGSSLTDRK